MEVPAQPVVVGVDGSEQSFQAASWATDEATRRGAPLHILLVNDDPTRADDSERVVREAAARARCRTPRLDVTGAVVPGHAAEELIHRSSTAQLIVVGSRGLGRFVRGLLGSVSVTVATHSVCPVVVVRGPGITGGPVVVGVDGSFGSQVALRFASMAAAQHAAELVAVTAWPALATEYPVDTTLFVDERQLQRQLEGFLTDELAQWRQKHPDARVRAMVRRGHPVKILTEIARDAALLVVGHRGRGDFAELLLGSVASGVLAHSPSPVAIVHTDEAG